LINTPKPGYETLTGKAIWMLDSGASCHMTGDLNLIENVQDVRPVGVGLPNGKETMANKKGTVKLSKNLKLNNVLYTPDLRCNLISIAQVSRDLNCYVTFYDDICFLQDRTSRSLIGVGEAQGGVYYYKGASQVKVQANAVDATHLWHSRLGIRPVKSSIFFLVI